MSLEAEHHIYALERQISHQRQEFDATRSPGRLKELRRRITQAQSKIIALHLEEALGWATGEVKRAKSPGAKKKAESQVTKLSTIIEAFRCRDSSFLQKPFLWPMAFPDVFYPDNSMSGFDIVLANPPYVRQEKLDPADQEAYSQSFGEVYCGTADILVSFYARALQILRPGGWLAFITSNKYMRAAYGRNLRAHLPHAMAISRIIDFGDLPLFEANGKQVSAYPAVLIGRKNGRQSHAGTTRVADLTYSIRRKLAEERRSVNPDNVRWILEDLAGLVQEVEVPNYPQVLLHNEGWILEDPELIRLFSRLMTQGKALGQFVKGRMYRGIVTGLNEAFVIDENKRTDLLSEDPNCIQLIKPWLRGRDIQRWHAKWAGLYVIHVPWSQDINRYPGILSHLEWYKTKLEGRPEAARGSYPWYANSRWAAEYYQEFDLPKVIWPRNNGPLRMQFALDTEGYYLNDKGYMMPMAPPWLTVILNSRLMHWIADKLCSKLQNGWFELKSDSVVERLPIVVPDSSGRDRLMEFLSRSKSEDGLNELVEELYSVAPAEREALITWAERQVAAFGTEQNEEDGHED